MKSDQSVEAMLSVDRICAGYGRIQVLNDLSFAVPTGMVYGIIGPNGSGKTTIFNTLAGLIRPSSGRILFDGKDITRVPTHMRCRMGIGRTFQIPRPFERMSVFENVLSATVFGTGVTERAAREVALQSLELTNLAEKRELRSGTLTLLDRKRLEIARALGTRPTLLLLDEVAAGLTSHEIDDVINLVARLKRLGYTVIWVEHIIETMVRATDRLLCIAEGRRVVEGKPLEVMQSKEVEKLYLGVEMSGQPAAEN